jgi:hypothetical protein
MSTNLKSYKNNKTGEIIKIIDTFDNIAIMENLDRIAVSQLNDTKLYTPVMNSMILDDKIDVNTFFNNENTYNMLAQQIANIPQDKIIDTNNEQLFEIKMDNNIIPATNESALIMVDDEDEKLELSKKYGISNNAAVSKQNDMFDKILNPNKDKLNSLNSPIYDPPMNQISKEDPMITMFKNVKRNTDFSISIDIVNKIPRPDFIEMMEDSYDVSIINYLASEFTNTLIKNPSMIEDIIKKKIREIVYETSKTLTTSESKIKSTKNIKKLNNKYDKTNLDIELKSDSDISKTTKKPKSKNK